MCLCVSPAASPKIIKLREEPSDYSEPPRGKSPAINSTLVPVKGISNLGNTCFFNAVMQVGMTMRSDVFLKVAETEHLGGGGLDIIHFNHFYYSIMQHLVRINTALKSRSRHDYKCLSV